MPRNYKCRACGVVHEPPTGKHCQHRDDIPAQQQTEHADTLLPLLRDISDRMETMEQRFETMQGASAVEPGTPQRAQSSTPNQAVLGIQDDDIHHEPASPETVRMDSRLMQDAARRLRRLELAQQGEDDLRALGNTRAAGKRSGSVMTATDKVVKSVDWPHMHVRRMVAGRLKGIHFNELKVEEFVFGFLNMIEMPGNDMDFRGMLRILRNLMQDAMEFSWPNARRFYETVGLQVEWGTLKWSDQERINHLRMTYARTNFPARKDEIEAPKPSLLPAPPGTKCCLPYQRHACEQDKDHPPYVHACAYCLKTKTAICRHPENDCYRKTNDAAKNGKAREPPSPLA